MHRHILLVAAIVLGAAAVPAVAADEATWSYSGTDALAAEATGTVTVSLSVDGATFPADLPVGYRHFLLAADPEDPGTGIPMAGEEIGWSRGGDSGTVTVDSDGGFVLPDTPFQRASTPTLGSQAGDQHQLRLTLPEGTYYLYSDLVDLSSPTTRVSGEDRYATAAAASTRFFRPGVDVAYVASGETFPDALAAGPAAAHHGAPLLLTARDTLPRATRDELRRLAPTTIVLVGGEVAVSEDVVRELQPYAGRVTRVAGSDRYDTAARLARHAWGSATVDAAYVANGEGFADALGASARAALLDVPVLLVQRDTVPDATGTTLDVLGVDQVTVAGGAAVVSAQVVTALDDRVGSATRRSGADRYATSAALAERSGSGRTLLVATGETFPDGLTAGSLARRLNADLLLTRPGAVPDVVADRAGELAPRRVYGLGGTTALARNALRTFDQLRTALTPLYLTPVLDEDQGGFATLTVD